MDLRLTLATESPFYVGSGRRAGYYGASLPYVPGRVLRAAFARAITDECVYVDVADPAGRRRWVEFRDGEACGACRWRNWCRAFPRIGFGDATPHGARPYPQTAVRCKYEAQHRPLDLLALWLRLTEERARSGRLPDPPDVTCPECGGRVERAVGDHRQGRPVEVERVLLQHVGMEPATQSAAEKLLFAIDAVAPRGREGEPLRLTARIRWPDGEGVGDWALPGVLENGTTPLHVGARTSTGLGRCTARIEAEEEADPREPAARLRQRLERFRQQVGAAHGDWYAPLLLLSDAALDLQPPDPPPGGTGDERFLEVLEEALHLGPVRRAGWRLRLAFADHAWTRGWDTSRAGPDRGRPPQLHLLRGSVLVLHRPGHLDDVALESLVQLERSGVGLRLSEGFGWVSVCDSFHVEYAVREVTP